MSGKKFIQNSIFALITCIALVMLSYHFVDKPIALFVQQNHLPDYPFFLWISKIANVILAFAALSLIVLSIKAVLHPISRFQKQLFTASLAIIVTAFFRILFGSLFYRYWVKAGVDANPTFINDQVYGFTLTHVGSHGAFPSGHTAMTFCAMTFIWILLPKWRPLALLFCLFQIIGLIAVNHHFLSDTIGGAFLGIVSTLFAQRLFTKY